MATNAAVLAQWQNPLTNNTSSAALLLWPAGGITEGTAEGDRIGKHIYIHWFQMHYIISTLNQGPQASNLAAPYNTLGIPQVSSYLLIPTKGQYGTQGAQFVQNITTYFPNGANFANSYVAWLGNNKPECFDPMACGFWVKRGRTHKIMELAQGVNGGTYTPTGGSVVARGNWSFRNKLVKFDTDAHTTPDTPIPAVVWLNYCPFAVTLTYTYKMVFSNV